MCSEWLVLYKHCNAAAEAHRSALRVDLAVSSFGVPSMMVPGCYGSVGSVLMRVAELATTLCVKLLHAWWGGMISATILTLAVIPTVFLLWQKWKLNGYSVEFDTRNLGSDRSYHRCSDGIFFGHRRQ